MVENLHSNINLIVAILATGFGKHELEIDVHGRVF
jgi:hypothetical protein